MGLDLKGLGMESQSIKQILKKMREVVIANTRLVVVPIEALKVF